jgi:hypothetical protein
MKNTLFKRTKLAIPNESFIKVIIHDKLLKLFLLNILMQIEEKINKTSHSVTINKLSILS